MFAGQVALYAKQYNNVFSKKLIKAGLDPTAHVRQRLLEGITKYLLIAQYYAALKAAADMGRVTVWNTEKPTALSELDYWLMHGHGDLRNYGKLKTDPGWKEPETEEERVKRVAKEEKAREEAAATSKEREAEEAEEKRRKDEEEEERRKIIEKGEEGNENFKLQ